MRGVGCSLFGGEEWKGIGEMGRPATRALKETPQSVLLAVLWRRNTGVRAGGRCQHIRMNGGQHRFPLNLAVAHLLREEDSYRGRHVGWNGIDSPSWPGSCCRGYDTRVL